MLNKTLLAVALVVSLASATGAIAASQDRRTDSYNQTFPDPPRDDAVSDRAKGNID